MSAWDAPLQPCDRESCKAVLAQAKLDKDTIAIQAAELKSMDLLITDALRRSGADAIMNSVTMCVKEVLGHSFNEKTDLKANWRNLSEKARKDIMKIFDFNGSLNTMTGLLYSLRRFSAHGAHPTVYRNHSVTERQMYNWIATTKPRQGNDGSVVHPSADTLQRLWSAHCKYRRLQNPQAELLDKKDIGDE